MRLRRIAAAAFRFLVVGGISTLIEVGVFNLAFVLAGWDPVVAKVVASLVALVNAYFGNRAWTFRARARRPLRTELALFLATNLLCAVLGAAIVAAGTAVFGSEDIILVNVINLFSIVVVVLVRFVLYYAVVFRHIPPTADGTDQEQLAP